MRQIEVQYFQLGRPSLATRIQLPSKWRSPQDLVRRFFDAYATHYDAPDPALYQLISVASRTVVHDLKDIQDGAVLSVALVDDFDDYCDAHWFALHEKHTAALPLMSYLRTKKKMRDRRVTTSKPTHKVHVETDVDYDFDVPRGPPTKPDSGPKDWGKINYKKNLCPFVIEGRRCPKGDDCTYAHTFDDLRLPQRDPRPGTCPYTTTAAHKLPPAEYWQMGAFAEPARQHPDLWKRMTRNLITS